MVLAITLVFSRAEAQRGKIIRPASTNILDPNADGFISKTSSGFSTDGDYLDEFELPMFGIPKLEGDVAGDNIGKVCGITDLIPDPRGFSVYAVRDGSDNLIFRFRVGDDNPSVEAWTILLDTDGNIGADDPNATAGNPGFEIDITLIKRNNSGVLIYDLDGRDDCPSPTLFYAIDSHFQISIADEVSCGDPDYFYDFYVPFAEVAAAFGIDINTGMRYVAVTNVSATCAMNGNVSDISGIDNNDPKYSGCETCAFVDLVNNQCLTPIVDLCTTCPGFEKDKVSAPIIDEPIRAGQTVVTGATIEEDIFIRLQVFTNTAPDGSTPAWGTTPREEIGVYATGTLWSVNLTNPLLDLDKIVAIAQKDEFTLPCGANDDNSSSTSVTVVSPNNPPVASDQTITVAEDGSVAIGLSGTDPENDPLTYTILDIPLNGALHGSPPNVNYTPAADFTGSDSFTFHVNDGIFSSSVPGMVSITVTPVNDDPQAYDLSVTTTEDTGVQTTLTASDVDGDVLAFSVVVPPEHGVLSGTAPALTYTPDADFFGQDLFVFRVNDGTVNSNEATVFITINADATDPPVAFDQALTTTEDTPVSMLLSGMDPDFDVLAYEIVSSPTHGTLSGTPPDLAYRPAANYSGTDAFTFRVSDGGLNSAPATVAITVSPVNDKPVAFNQAVPYELDTPEPVTLTASDVDGDALTFSVFSSPTHGTLSGSPPDVIYQPDAGYTGDDIFTFLVNDGSEDSDVATVALHLAPIANVAPTAFDQTVTTPEDTPVQIVLTASDDNGDPLTYVITELPGNGTLNVSGVDVTYSSNADFSGSDSFKFKADDGVLSSLEATISITVNAVNDPPVANGQSVATNKNTPRSITLTGSDIEGSPLNFVIVGQPLHGSLTLNGATADYSPDPNYTGSDHFSFVANDGLLNSFPADVAVLVNAVGSSPLAQTTHVSTPEDVAVDIDLAGLVTDADSDPLTYSIVQPPGHGSIVVNNNIVTYTPDLDYASADTVKFAANDGSSDSNTGSIFIKVLPVNDPPVAEDQSLTTNEDTDVTVVLTGSDIDGDSFSYTVATNPKHGTLIGMAPGLTYRPDENFNGSDDFTFYVYDGAATSSVATISLTVSSINDPPSITPLTSLPPTREDSTLRVCLNVLDADGDAIDFGNPVNTLGGGTMVRQSAPFDFCYTFTPSPNYNGRSLWGMTVIDSKGSTGSSPADILIHPVNDPPVALNDYASVNANLLLSFDPAVNDLAIASPFTEFYDIYAADSSDLINLIDIVDGPFHGTASIAGDGRTIDYRASSFTFVGTDSIKYMVCDSGHPALCTTAVVFIQVADSDFPFKVYEGVSPNNDGLNDYMRIEGIHKYNRNLVRIFDRFNNIVWEAEGYDNESVRWDGQANRGIARSRLPDGTYYYTVFLEETRKIYSGYVILKQN